MRVQGRRQWRKVHLAMDTTTSDIRAVEVTPGSDGPSRGLLANRCRATDGAYDTRRCHTAIIDRQATAIIPIRRNGRLWKEDCPAAIARNETLRATRHFGRAFRNRWTGYHARSRIEAKILSQVRSNRWRATCSTSRLSATASPPETPTARPPDRQTAEIQIRVALINRFNALGTVEIVRGA